MSKKHWFLFGAVIVIIAGYAGFVLRQMSDPSSGIWKNAARETGRFPQAVDSAVVDLKSGDTYALTIEKVEKEIDGKKYQMLAYNGSLPGPTLRVPQGATITLSLKNGGETATTLHAHGVRAANAFDGVPGLTQKEVAPGESFTYQLSFPDAGAFWYHPHVRTDYGIESGLYAGIIVTPKESAYWPPANREVPLMLDDIALDDRGMLPFDDEIADHTLMGRFGNVMFVNGKTKYELQAKQGEVVRLYLTNAANTRLFNFTLPGAKMKVIGADAGRYEKEIMTDAVLIAPGERRVVDVWFEESGTLVMKHKTPGKEYVLGAVTVDTEKAAPDFSRQFSVTRTNAAVMKELRGLIDAYSDKVPDKTIRMSMSMNADAEKRMRQSAGHMGGGHMMPNDEMMSGSTMGGGTNEKYEWEDTMGAMNAGSNSNMMKWTLIDDKTKKINMDIDDWSFASGSKVKIRVLNDPNSAHPMQHPLHFHGNNFMVLAVNGVKNENAVWMDTVLIPSGEYVDILLEASNPGKWMAHCHILEHAEAGMMLSYEVK